MKPKSKMQVVNINQARFWVTTHDFGGVAQIVVRYEGLIHDRDLKGFSEWLRGRRGEFARKPTLLLMPNSSALAWTERSLFKWVAFDNKPPPFGLN